MATGKQMALERDRRGWNQTFLGKKIGVSQKRISDLENKAELRPRVVEKLDKIFGGPEWRQQTAGSAVEPRAESENIMAEMDRRWRECVERIETLHADTLRIEKRLGALESFRGDAERGDVAKRKTRRRE